MLNKKDMERPTEEMEVNKQLNDTTKSKKARLFSAKEFRNKLNTADQHEALVNFLNICLGAHGESAIKEYLAKGGSCLELLQLFETESQNLHCVILNLVNHILLLIISKLPSYHTQNLEACRYFLNTKLPLINKMLSFASTGNERKTILKLLTTFVTFSHSLTKDILQNVNLNPGNLELLTKQTGEKDSVRSIFIKFIVAFLLDGHFPTISLLLEKKGVLSNVMKGLNYDEADTVCIILSALKTFVLENTAVSKTMKMKLFNTPVIKEIVNLYNWKGPENFSLNTKKKKNVEINKYDKAKVSESVHRFLLTLCTSHRFGIIFSDHSVGLGKTSSNNLLFSILYSLEKPWEHSFASDLVLKICKSCPDLVKTVWNQLKGALEPRDSENWRKAVTFATDLLEELEPQCVEYCFAELSLTQRVQVVQVLVAPLAILKTILPENYEFSSHSTKYHVYIFISRSLLLISKYIDFAQKYFVDKEFLLFKNALSNYIFRNYPPINVLIKNMTEKSTEKSSGEEYLKFLSITFDIFQYYEKLCSQQFDELKHQKTHANFRLEELYERLELLKTEESSTDETKSFIQDLETKMFKVFLNIDQSLFKTSTSLFEVIFSSLISHYRKTKDTNSFETLEKILLLTDIFIGYKEEVRIWLDSIFYFENFDDIVGKFLAQSLKNTDENLATYLEELKSIDNEVEIYRKKDVNNLLEAIKSGLEIASVVRMSYKTFSPLIIGFLHCLPKITDKSEMNSLKIYFNYLLVNLLHFQTTPTCLISLVLGENYKKHAPKIAAKYFESWRVKREMYISKRAKGSLTYLQKFWIENNISEHKEIVHSSVGIFLLNMSTFYIANLTQLERLDANYVKKSLELINLLLENRNKSDLKTVMNVIFCNPIIFQYFSPLKTTENSSKELCTNFIFENVKIFKDLGLENSDLEYFQSLLIPYRRKMLISLQKMLEKPKKLNFENYEGFLDSIKVFGLNEDNCTTIINQCLDADENYFVSSDNNQLTLFYLILCLSIDIFLDLSNEKIDLQPLDGEIINKISQKLTFLNNNDNKLNTSELADLLKRYLIKFPHSFQFVSEKVFESILIKDQYCPNNSALAATILKHNKMFLSSLESNVSVVCTKKGLLFPILEAAIDLNADDTILKNIYEKIEPFISKCLEKPQKAGQYVEKYFESVLILIKRFMIVTDTCTTFFDKVKKFNVTEEFHYKLLSEIFGKVSENNLITPIRFYNYVVISLHQLNSFVKNKETTEEVWSKLERMVDTFTSNLKKIENSNEKMSDLCENEAFKSYCKFCLKHGISSKSLLLKNLNAFILIDVFDENNASIILDMATSHSEFLNILLSEDEEIKAELLYLIFLIFKKWPELIQRNYFSVILSAYHATCRRSDRIILGILQIFEKNVAKSDFYSFKPFLFGSAAASHYSVRQNYQNVLWRQPKVGDVLDLLDEKLVNETIKKFQYETELNQNIDEMTNNVGENSHVYDLAFLLPLFTSLLVTENVVPTYKFTKSGALSLTVVALSSKDKDTRLAASYVLYRFYNHLEAKPENKDKVLWVRYVEALCRGTSALKDLKMNSFAAIFWARMALILTMPTHTLYLPMSSYLTSKPCPDLSTIPELYTWLHDSSVNYLEHQAFVLTLLIDGMKSKEDFKVALRSVIFKMIMELCNSCVSTKDVRLLVVKVLESACKIPQGAKLLTTSYGLLSWMLNFVQHLTVDDFEIVETVVGVLVNIFKNKDKDFVSDTFMVSFILNTIIDSDLLKCLKNEHLQCFLDVLYKCVLDDFCLSKKQLQCIIDYVNDNFCNYLLSFGKSYVILDDYFSINKTVFLLRKLTLKWMDNNTNLL